MGLHWHLSIWLLAISFNIGQKRKMPDHAIYIGVIQFDHQELGAAATIHVKVFKDDLRDALRNAFPDREVGKENTLCQDSPARLTDYFARHFSGAINGQPLEMELRECRRENEVYWLQFSAPCPADWRSVEIKADFFMELFPTQSNMVTLYHGEDRRFLRLTKKASSQRFEW